ncbi:MAG: polysaccharide deacetylase [Gammaproteobacteria bacterium]|nr:MAG: polysaccharide deacetylase [Gammaproteobacteria bacterium]
MIPTSCARFGATKTIIALILAGMWSPLVAAPATEPSSHARVFLTFDDGPIDVTLNVLEVLRRHHIKATFFVNGIHLTGQGGENETRSAEALRRIIADGHVLGDHSFDHMRHNSTTGIASSVDTYRDMTSDLRYFVPENRAIVNAALGELAARPNNQVAGMARLPYTNTWILPGYQAVCGICTTDSDAPAHADQTPASGLSATRSDGIATRIAETLFHEYGMTIFGWDIHWQPANWQGPASSETLEPAMSLAGRINALIDRPPCASDHTGDSIRCQHLPRFNKVVVLTHDFLFENSARGRGADINIPQLEQLIRTLQASGYRFDTLDRY